MSVVLAVRGEVDLVTAPELGAIVDSMIDLGHREMTLDLAACGFMDASGLRVIAAAVGRVGSTGNVGEFHRSLQRTGHDGRVNPKQQPVEVPACQAQRCRWKSARRSG